MPYLIAVSGPTAAGKTFFSRKLIERAKSIGMMVERLSTDEFYYDLSDRSMEDRIKVNYDLPSAIDSTEFLKVIDTLSNGYPTEVPVYDFTTHTRTGKMRKIDPVDLILVEGIFSLAFEDINSIYDLKVYITLDQDLRLIRRLQRDMEERGRSLQSVLDQYLSQVRPTQQTYVIQDRKKADLILLGDTDHQKVIELIISQVEKNSDPRQ